MHFYRIIKKIKTKVIPWNKDEKAVLNPRFHAPYLITLTGKPMVFNVEKEGELYFAYLNTRFWIIFDPIFGNTDFFIFLSLNCFCNSSKNKKLLNVNWEFSFIKVYIGSWSSNKMWVTKIFLGQLIFTNFELP